MGKRHQLLSTLNFTTLKFVRLLALFNPALVAFSFKIYSYTREAYLDLVKNIKRIIPGEMWSSYFSLFNSSKSAVSENASLCVCMCVYLPEVSLSSDFISGFCGESEEDHQQTLSLIREVGYNVGFLFAYSMRKVRSEAGVAGQSIVVDRVIYDQYGSTTL